MDRDEKSDLEREIGSVLDLAGNAFKVWVNLTSTTLLLDSFFPKSVEKNLYELSETRLGDYGNYIGVAGYLSTLAFLGYIGYRAYNAGD